MKKVCKKLLGEKSGVNAEWTELNLQELEKIAAGEPWQGNGIGFAGGRPLYIKDKDGILHWDGEDIHNLEVDYLKNGSNQGRWEIRFKYKGRVHNRQIFRRTLNEQRDDILAGNEVFVDAGRINWNLRH